MRLLSKKLAALFILTTLAFSHAAISQELSVARLLVARSHDHLTVFGTSVILAKTLADGSNVGFILNKPTPVTLGEISERVPAARQADSLYFGGPVLAEHFFALVKTGGNPGNGYLQVSPNIAVVADGTIVDQIILSESATARIFAGMLTWEPGALDEEISQGLWAQAQAEESLLLSTPSDELWIRVLQRTAMRR